MSSPTTQLRARTNVRSLGKTALKLLGLLAFTWLFVWPLAMLIYGAFSTSPLSPRRTWTLSGFERLLTDPNTLGALGSTLIYATVITILSMAVAVFFAVVTTSMDVPFRRFITPIMVILVAMPTVLYSLAWAMLGAGRSGLINQALDAIGLDALAEIFNTRSWFGLVLVTVLKASALAYMILVGSFRNQNAALEEAARVSGASKTTSFFSIELPALLPALGAASLFIFVKGLEAFETPAVLGLPAGINVYATHIYDYLRGGYEADYPAASASSLVIVAILALLVLMQLKLTGGGKSYASVGGRAQQASLRKPGKWTAVITGLLLAYFFIALILPTLQVILAAFQPYLGASELTTENFRTLLSTPNVTQALQTTLLVSIVGGLVTVILALVVSFAFMRMRGKVARYIQLASWVPAAMPGLVLGLAFLWSVLLTPGARSMYGTVWILVIALAVATVPLATRTLEGALAQINIDMEEAARVSGAGFFRALGATTIRLLMPSLISAWFLVAITMSGILDVPILLGTARTEMIATVSFGYYNSGDTVLAAALYVIFAVALALIAGAAALVWFLSRIIIRGLQSRDRGTDKHEPTLPQNSEAANPSREKTTIGA